MVDRLPTKCPICGATIVAQLFASGFVAHDLLELFARCTSPICFRSFISLYALDRGRSQGQQQQYFVFQRSIPAEAKPIAVSSDVAKISPSFIRISAQACLAEEDGLDEIAGPGYRKALEFLIKDYAILLQTDEAAKDEIKRIQLGNVIAKYLDGEKLPIVSKRAAWLGNDETHYERRWVGKDLDDLKKLISAVEHFIAMEVLVKELPTAMPDPAKS